MSRSCRAESIDRRQSKPCFVCSAVVPRAVCAVCGNQACVWGAWQLALLCCADATPMGFGGLIARVTTKPTLLRLSHLNCHVTQEIPRSRARHSPQPCRANNVHLNSGLLSRRNRETAQSRETQRIRYKGTRWGCSARKAWYDLARGTVSWRALFRCCIPPLP